MLRKNSQHIHVYAVIGSMYTHIQTIGIDIAIISFTLGGGGASFAFAFISISQNPLRTVNSFLGLENTLPCVCVLDHTVSYMFS